MIDRERDKLLKCRKGNEVGMETDMDTDCVNTMLKGVNESIIVESTKSVGVGVDNSSGDQ